MYQKKENFSSQGFIECPHCGHETNEPGATHCFFCKESLFSDTKLNKGNLRIVGKDAVGKTKKKKHKGITLKYSLLLGGVLASSVFFVSTLNASSPEAALKKARGRISFGGEPCSQRLLNEKVSKEIEEINKRVRFRYADINKNKDQIQELIDGEIDIAFSEKAYLNSHLERARNRGVEIKAIPYAYDGIAYITNKKNKVKALTVKELEDIFEGRITNWKQLGGEDRQIVPILKDGLWANPMGIRLDDGLNPNTVFVKSRARGKKLLEKKEGAIFYTSASLAAQELNKVNVISIEKGDGTVVSPVLEAGITNQKAIDSSEYPLVRALLVIVNGEVFNDKNNLNLQQKGVRAFSDYLISPKGQAIVEEAGFVAKYEVNREKTSKFSFFNKF